VSIGGRAVFSAGPESLGADAEALSADLTDSASTVPGFEPQFASKMLLNNKKTVAFLCIFILLLVKLVMGRLSIGIILMSQ